MQNAILSAKDLIKKRKLIEEKKKKEFVIEVGDIGQFKFRTPDIFDIIDSQQFKGGGYEDDYIIYSCMVSPNPKDKELQEAYGCNEPFDIIDALFLPGEKQSVGNAIVEQAGYKKEVVKLVDEVKNGLSAETSNSN